MVIVVWAMYGHLFRIRPYSNSQLPKPILSQISSLNLFAPKRSYVKMFPCKSSTWIAGLIIYLSLDSCGTCEVPDFGDADIEWILPGIILRHPLLLYQRILAPYR